MLVVRWGDASVERPIAVPAGARKTFEFYLHTMDVAGAVSVTLLREGKSLASTELPLRAVPAEVPFTLCVAEAGAGADTGSDCTGKTAAAALPRSVRGYDAVDRVDWRGGSEETLPVDQRLAFARWRAMRALDEAGSLRRFVNVYVGNDDVRFLDNLETATPDGTQISVIPAVAGG